MAFILKVNLHSIVSMAAIWHSYSIFIKLFQQIWGSPK